MNKPFNIYLGSDVFFPNNLIKKTFVSQSLWNAKLTETQIFKEHSIKIDRSLIELKSSLIELKSSLIQLESSLIQLEISLIQ